MSKYIELKYNSTLCGPTGYMAIHINNICTENISLLQFKKIIKFIDQHYDQWHEAYTLIMYWLELNHKNCVNDQRMRAAASIKRKIKWMEETY